MNQEEALALWKQGKEAWNAWAEKMLAERKALEDKGEWEVSITPRGVASQNERTKKWFKDACAVFSSEKTPHTFAEATFFEGFLFPSVSEWSAATFEGSARFFGATFQGIAVFIGATFKGRAEFSRATFEDNAGFNSVCFEKPTHFSRVRFNTSASFSSAQIKQAFDLSGARLKEVPDFRQTHCEEAPLLDDVHIDSTIIKQRKSSHDPDFTVTANYRALKRLAIQGHDHKHEVEFFAEELRAQRIMVHKFLGWDWWLSALFAITSDYGRSILRPIAWWLPVMLISALSYLLSATLAKAPKSWGDAIYQSIVSWYHGIQLVIPTLFHISWLPEKTEFQQASCKGGSVVAAAYNLAVSKGLIIPGIADRTLITQAYDCLYDGEVPFSISWIMGIQTLLSAALLFLLLLGIRNRFKLK